MPRPERALDGDSALTRFALDLRTLRDRAGRPGYRSLAEMTDYSVSTLSAAAGGRSLPTLAVTLAYVAACSGDVEHWERRWHSVAAELATEAPPKHSAGSADDITPYVGLAAFDAGDSRWFFGREKLTDGLVERVGTQRFVAVFGASGAGKSSLLRAGLLAEWEAHGRSSALITPGEQPMRAYDAALASLTSADGDALLVVDQFEELFTVCQSELERSQFLDRLLADARRQHDRLRIVIGVRADFYSHCAEHAGLAEELRDGQFLVGPMTAEQLRAAVIRPAALAGGNVESSLLATVIADCAGQPGVLPLLSHALRETWLRRSGARMTLAGYQAAGGITHAIAQTAERTFDEFDERGKHLAKSLFLRLVALGDGTGDTKRRVDLEEIDVAGAEVASVLRRLTDARLIMVDRGHVEVTHEALIRCWPRLAEWLVRERQHVRTHRELTGAAGQWSRLGRDREALYRGVQLSAARGLEDGRVGLSRVERDFLAASVAEENLLASIARRRTNRLRVLVCLLSVLLVAAGTLSVVAVRARDGARADERSVVAQRDATLAQTLLAQAASLDGTDPATAGQLGLAAYRLASSAQARSMVLQSAANLRSYTASIGGTLLGVSPNGRLAATDVGVIELYHLDSAAHIAREVGTVPGQSGAVYVTAESATFSPDGTLMLIDYGNSPPALYDTSDPAHPRLLRSLPTPDGTAGYFGSDRYLITEGTSQTVWDLSQPRHPVPISTIDPPQSPAHGIDPVALSEDGHLAVEVIRRALSDTVLIADTTTRRARITWSTSLLVGSRAPIAMAHGVLAVALNTGVVGLWRVLSPNDVVKLGAVQVGVGGIESVAVSPDGTEVAVGLGDAVDAWDLGSNGVPRLVAKIAYTSHNNEMSMLGFQNDHTLVAHIGGFDSATALWVEFRGPALGGADDTEGDVSFSSDGRTLATGFESPTAGAGAYLWDVRNPFVPRLRATLRGGPLQPTHAVGSAVLDTGIGVATVFAPKRHLLATGDSQHGRIWDVANPARPRTLSVLPDTPLLFSADAKVLLGSNGTVWDIGDPMHPRLVARLGSGFLGPGTAAFSSDGRLLAFVGSSTILLYRVNGARPPEFLRSIDFPATGLAFAPTGQTLAAVSRPGSTEFWDLRDPTKPIVLSTMAGRSGGTVAPVFSHDGRYVAIPENDGSTNIWNIQNPRHPASFAVLAGVTPLEFDPTAETLAVHTKDGSFQLFDIDLAAAIRRLCTGTPTISRSMWAQYVPTLPYQPPCASGW